MLPLEILLQIYHFVIFVSDLFCYSIFASFSSEFDYTKQIFINSFPWLFPGGIGDIWDPTRGQIPNIRKWAKHLLNYHDGRFQRDQIFSLYAFNMIQRSENNGNGNFFVSSDRFIGKCPPTVEDLKRQVANGNTKYIDMLRYYSGTNSRGTDSYWRGKTEELRTWIDYHVAQGNGPPTIFLTLSCAENWWPELTELIADMEDQCGNTSQAKSVRENNFTEICISVKRYPLLVNQFFLMRTKEFMKTVVKDGLDIPHYWGRVEFAPGRGQIHLHLLCIGKNQSYLKDYHDAKTEAKKTQVLNQYATEILDMTADVDVNDDPDYSIDTSPNSRTALRKRFSEVKDDEKDIKSLAEGCMVHKCNGYCMDTKNKKCTPRECRFDYGKESAYGEKDSEGKILRTFAAVVTDKKGVQKLQMKRTKSRKVVQLSKPMLQSWRANCDLQLLIYNSDPRSPDIAEIESVTRYVVAYAGKKHNTSKTEREAIQNIIKG